MVLGIISIVTVAVITVLVTAGAIKEKWYPLCVWIMSAGLVYATTLLGIYVVGSDIQGEIYTSRQTLENGIDFVNTYSISVISIVFAPFLSQLLNLDIIWVYKAILPMFLTAAPVFLYLAFKTQFGGLKAFYATLFFIVMPTFSMEIPTIGKSMVAEFFYALMIFAMVSDWKWYTKGLAMTLCAICAIVSHYTVGVIIIANLLVIFGVRVVTNWSRWKLFAFKRMELWLMPLIIIVCIGGFYFVYSQMADGWITHLVSNITSGYANKITDVGDVIVKRIFENKPISIIQLGRAPAILTLDPNYLYFQGHLTQIGMGLDFFKQPVIGKVFRLIQYFTQFMVVLGLGYMLFRAQRYKFTAEYIAGMGCSFVLLIVCMFMPGFSSLINMSRFYHLSLFFLAPMLIVGLDVVSDIGGRIRK